MISRRKALLLLILSCSVVIFHFILGKGQRFSSFASLNGQTGDINEHIRLIEEISECIIPSTGSPGAKEAGVSQYIVNVMSRCKSKRDKTKIIEGLNDLEEYCQGVYSRSFVDCDPGEQFSVLSRIESRERISSPLLAKVRNKLFGSPFLEQFKWLVVSGYCTSKIGATAGLAYDELPNGYLSCISYQPGQPCWATS